MFTYLLCTTLFHRRRAPLAAVCALLGCASSNDGIERLKDGSYRLECRETLADCLALAEQRCSNYGYEVLSGRQENRIFGPEQLQTKYVNSAAIVMCRNANGLFDDTPQPSSSVARQRMRQQPGKAATCVPGASQSCTGPGGCSGGQSCAPDGVSYLPCDCGAPNTVQSTTPEAPPSTPSALPPAPSTTQSAAEPAQAPTSVTAPSTPALTSTASDAPPAPSVGK
jgi:hypothetical protein